MPEGEVCVYVLWPQRRFHLWVRVIRGDFVSYQVECTQVPCSLYVLDLSLSKSLDVEEGSWRESKPSWWSCRKT